MIEHPKLLPFVVDRLTAAGELVVVADCDGSPTINGEGPIGVLIREGDPGGLRPQPGGLTWIGELGLVHAQAASSLGPDPFRDHALPSWRNARPDAEDWERWGREQLQRFHQENRRTLTASGVVIRRIGGGVEPDGRVWVKYRVGHLGHWIKIYSDGTTRHALPVCAFMAHCLAAQDDYQTAFNAWDDQFQVVQVSKRPRRFMRFSRLMGP